jgi:DNA-binding MarR family transcriptional regulator
MSFILPSETVFYSIERAIKEYRKFAQKKLSEQLEGLTVDQGMVLLFLDRHPNISQKEMASLIFRDNASLTRMITLMVEKGYLSRSINPDDRRRFVIEITDKGREAIDKMPSIITENRKKSLRGLSNQEVDQLKILLNKIADNCKN